MNCSRAALSIRPKVIPGYGDSIGTDLKAFIGPEMRADWAANREALLKFWESGQSPTIFPDCLPWLYTHRIAGTSPWAVKHLDLNGH